MKIPKQIEGFNFVLIGSEKKPFEKKWQDLIHRKDDAEFQNHLTKGGNYGVQSNNSSVVIDGNSYFLVIVDFDKKEFQDKVIGFFPETFTTTSGSAKNCWHLWFASDNNKAFKVKDEKSEVLADVLGAGNQVIAPGSKHKSGSTYSVVKDIPIVFIPYAEIEAILKPYDKTPKKPEKEKKQYVPKGMKDDISSKILNSVSMKQILEELGINTSQNPTGCYFHSSVGGKCLGWNDETCHCFHCEKSWNRFSLIREAKNLSDKATFEWFAEKGNLINELKNSRKEYIENNKVDETFREAARVFTKEEQAINFSDIQPIFYDRAENWWLWNSTEYRWKLTDEVDILNMIVDVTGQDVITPKQRTLILNSLKQEGRRRIPKAIKTTWLQFKDEVFDIMTGERFKATPEYFVTNPIPYSLHKEKFKETPIMDRIFEEWVGKDYVKTLYQIIAYCLLPDYPIHRLFCLIGAGMNGKSCFLKLLRKFVGEDNTTSTELDRLTNSRFELTRLHKKLICVMGETNFTEMKQTAIIKSLTGQDAIPFEYKNKTPFSEVNYAKLLIATNNLPTTMDKTVGWYRRWLIIDFPNQFSEKKDILMDIPEEEYESLALKCAEILYDLLMNKEFHKEGSIEERMERYEAKSDFLQKFLEEFTSNENPNEYITCADFYKKFGAWCEENRYRQMAENTLGKKMKEKGIEHIKKYFDWLFDGKGGQLWVWAGLRWKN